MNIIAWLIIVYVILLININLLNTPDFYAIIVLYKIACICPYRSDIKSLLHANIIYSNIYRGFQFPQKCCKMGCPDSLPLQSGERGAGGDWRGMGGVRAQGARVRVAAATARSAPQPPGTQHVRNVSPLTPCDAKPGCSLPLDWKLDY